jgi:hypothetical protein
MQLSWPVGIQTSWQSTLDSLMTNTMLAREVTLYFPPIQTICPYGQNNPGQIGNSYWGAGNPQPVFSQQNCTYCNGTGFIAIEPTGLVTMIINWKPSRNDPAFPKGTRHPEGVIKTRGFFTDLQAVLNCTRMEAYQELGSNHYNYILVGEPVIPSKLVPDRYYLAFWERA